MIELSYYIVLAITLIPMLIYGFLLKFSKRNSAEGNVLNENSERSDHRPAGGNKVKVSVIIPCYNEAFGIKRKIDCFLSQFAEIGMASFEIIVVSDGSTDGTNKVLKSFAENQFVRPIYLNQRQGKANAMNLGHRLARFPILLFSDTRQIIPQGTVGQLLSYFNCGSVDVVSSTLQNGNESSRIRQFINHLKVLESETGSTISIYGALFAMRKECYQPIPTNLILDDLYVSLSAIANGYKTTIDSKAIVIDVELKNFYSKERVFRLLCGHLQMIRKANFNLSDLSFKHLIYLYSQKYFKLTAPILWALLSILALFNSSIGMWHFGLTLSAITLVVLLKKSVAISISRYVLLLFRSFGKLKAYETPLWEKSIEI